MFVMGWRRPACSPAPRLIPCCGSCTARALSAATNAPKPWAAMLHSIWQGLLVVLLAATIVQALSHSRARTRCVVLLLALVTIPLCVPITLSILLRRLPSTDRAALAIAANSRIDRDLQKAPK